MKKLGKTWSYRYEGHNTMWERSEDNRKMEASAMNIGESTNKNHWRREINGENTSVQVSSHVSATLDSIYPGFTWIIGTPSSPYYKKHSTEYTDQAKL